MNDRALGARSTLLQVGGMRVRYERVIHILRRALRACLTRS